LRKTLHRVVFLSDGIMQLSNTGILSRKLKRKIIVDGEQAHLMITGLDLEMALHHHSLKNKMKISTTFHLKIKALVALEAEAEVVP
jgi:hypothetical protein